MHSQGECHERDSDQHGAGDRADAGHGTQDLGCFRQIIIGGDEPLDPGLEFCDLAVQQRLEIAIHAGEQVGSAEPLMRPDLRKEAFARLDKLPAL